MRVLHYPAFDRLEIRDLDVTPLAPDEVRLKVAACGICGSELESFRNHSPRRPPPLVMGHEFSGTVAEVGSEVREWREGDRAISHSVIHCGRCKRCERGETHLCPQRQIFGMHRPGAFAEFVNVPVRTLISWPDGLPAEAAAMAEPLANGIHVANLARHVPASTALVLGAGPIGLFCQQALQVLRGVRVIVADLSPERLALAQRLGAVQTINARDEDVARAVAAATDGEGADVTVDAVGAAVTKRTSIEALRAGGMAVWIGLHENEVTLDSYAITLPEKLVSGSYAATMDEMRLAVELMATGKVDAHSWLQRFALEDGVEAFERMLAAKGADIKAVLTP